MTTEDPVAHLFGGLGRRQPSSRLCGGCGRARRAPDLIILDTTDPTRPRARPLSTALARIVRSRAVNPKFIAGQLRHGPRGAAELAETVDRLVDFAQTTGAVASRYFDLLHEAYVADDAVRDFIVRENPAAAAAIAARLDTARRPRPLASPPQRRGCRLAALMNGGRDERSLPPWGVPRSFATHADGRRSAGAAYVHRRHDPFRGVHRAMCGCAQLRAMA
jgi:hypothetical protein